MIVKRKLFSKGTLTPEEKRKRRYERAADRLDESRGKAAAVHGVVAGGVLGGLGVSLSEINKESKLDSVRGLYRKKVGKELDKLTETYKKIDKTGDEVLKRAKEKLKKTGNPFTDAINEVDVINKVSDAQNYYISEATRKSRERTDKTLGALQRLSSRINKKANSRNKKIVAGAALAGIGVGALSNRSMKKRVEELRRKSK